MHCSVRVLFDESPSDHQGGQEQTHLQKVFMVIYLFKCYFCQIVIYTVTDQCFFWSIFLLESFQTKQYDGSAPLHQCLSQHFKWETILYCATEITANYILHTVGKYHCK